MINAVYFLAISEGRFVKSTSKTLQSDELITRKCPICPASIIISLPVASTKNVTINVTFNHVNSKHGPMGPENRIFQAV